jgi:predicted AlkP superfamily phosphohydrolase/phosphomutase
MKTVIIGFDAFDPMVFEELHVKGKTPNLSALVDAGGYSCFKVSNPPQSEVSWTSIATGLNPGGHGIFDFVHRNPKSYGRQVSLLPTKTTILGRQFVQPHSAPTIFDVAVDDGYPGISLWWPATFPARQASPVWSIPGLGTPDIFGRLGVGISYSIEGEPANGKKTRIELLTKYRSDQYKGVLEGPMGMALSGSTQTSNPFDLKIYQDDTGQLKIGRQLINLLVGKWSPIVELTFKVGLGVSIKAVTRAILTKTTPAPELYFLPLQLHPLRSPWPYGTPKSLLKNTWKEPGPFLTLGWPQDTTGLEEGFINDDQFLTLCEQINQHRERTLMGLLDTFQEGVLACVFDSLDRIQHMFFRDRMDVIETWYMKLDSLFGRIIERIEAKSGDEDIHVIVVSDHGFGEFNYKVNLNRWLINHDYLFSENAEGRGNLNQVDWGKSKAYAIGLNSLYLNLEGREGLGIVNKEMKTQQLQTLQDDLLQWRGPDGKPFIHSVSSNDESFKGPLTDYGPDLVVGYNPGYRASAQTGMGEWEAEEIEVNRDHWGADHCFDAEKVPGVLFSNQGLKNFPNPSYSEFPVLAINKEIGLRKDISAPTFSDEDQEKIDERLKELGYL